MADRTLDENNSEMERLLRQDTSADYVQPRHMFCTALVDKPVSAVIKKRTNTPEIVWGRIRYYGYTFFAEGIWVGIELDNNYASKGRLNHYSSTLLITLMLS